MNFIGTWIVGAISVGAAAWIVPGIEIVGGSYAAPIFTALFLSIVNALVKPVLQILGLPLTIVTLGIFQIIINAFMLELASYLSRNITHAGIVIESFGSAFFAAIVISIVTMLISGIVK